MGWELHIAKTAFPTFADDWDRLNSRFYSSHPYYDSRFVGPMLDFFATGKEQLCIYRSDDIVTGALILQSDGIGRWSSFRPSQSQATAVLLSDARLLETLFHKLPGINWTIELLSIDPRYSPDFSRLECVKIISACAQTIGIHPDLGFSEYWDKRAKNLKANVRRYLNRAENEFSTPELSEFIDHEEMNDGVARFGKLESAGWKGAAGTAVAMGNMQGAFYAEVLRRFALTRQAAVYELRVGEKLAASRLVISNDKMLVILKTAYDETLARFAPGRILLYQLIKKQLESQSEQAIEFYTNATRDQAEWATFGATIQNIQIFRSESFAASFSLLKVLRRNLRGADHRRSASETLPTLDVKACTSIEAFSKELYDLHEFAAKDNIEESIDWFDLLQKHVYPDDPGVRFYFVADNNYPTTILPLRFATKGRVRTVESLSNYYTSLYTPLLTNESDLLRLRNMLATATRDHGGAHVMHFAPMDIESPVYQGFINELRAIGWIPFSYFCFGNWYLKVQENWEGYLTKRSANLRSSIKRRNKKFYAAGGTLEIVTNLAKIEQDIDAYQAVYGASWKTHEPYAEFVPSLIRRLGAIGMLRLGIARLQGKPIAAQLWIVGEAKASIYKVAYHEEFSSYSPGTVLTSYLMQYVIEQDQVKEVDFLIGDDEYKRIWMSDRRERWGIVAYNPRTFIGLALLAKEILGRLFKSPVRKIRTAVLKTGLSAHQGGEEPPKASTRK